VVNYLFKHLVQVGQLPLDDLLGCYLVIQRPDLVLELILVVGVGKHPLALLPHVLMLLFDSLQLLVREAKFVIRNKVLHLRVVRLGTLLVNECLSLRRHLL
jgi:hypothetical protein